MSKIEESKEENNSYQYYLNQIYQTGDYLWKRVPNSQEVFTTCSIKAILEILINNELTQSPNPTIATFIRDSMKVPSSLISYYYEQKIGGTQYHYDEFILAASVIKPVCKLGFIATAGATGFIGLTVASRVSNYVCEIPSRLLTKISREVQDSNKEMSLREKCAFLLESVNLESTSESTLSAILKTITTDVLGDLFGKYMTTTITDINGAQEKIHKMDLWVKEHSPEQYADTFLMKYALQFSKGILASFILTPPARAIEDVPGLAINYLNGESELADQNLINASTDNSTNLFGTCPIN